MLHFVKIEVITLRWWCVYFYNRQSLYFKNNFIKKLLCLPGVVCKRPPLSAVI